MIHMTEPSQPSDEVQGLYSTGLPTPQTRAQPGRQPAAPFSKRHFASPPPLRLSLRRRKGDRRRLLHPSGEWTDGGESIFKNPKLIFTGRSEAWYRARFGTERSQ